MRDYPQLARKLTFILFIGQSALSAAMITTGTVNAIVGAELSGVDAWAGVPAAALLLATAFSAYGWGYLMDRWGRRLSLILGMLMGAGGGLLAGWAILIKSFPGFLGGLALMGAAQAAMQLGRFAAAEVSPLADRGKAIANVVLGGTVGSILGPLLVGPAGEIAKRAGVNELSGPYGTGVLIFIFGAIIFTFWLKPDPSTISKELADQNKLSQISVGETRTIPQILKQPGVIVAMTAMVLGQLVMVMLMVITSLYMKKFDHSLGDISVVISAHTFGMFAFSVISGRLADRFGRRAVIISGAGILVAASLASRLSSETFPLAIALFLLGLGWNFCYVGGSTLLADQLSPAEQSRTQGFNDLLIGMVSAAGSLGSGFVFASVGYRTMGILGAVVSLIPLTLTILWKQDKPAAITT